MKLLLACSAVGVFCLSQWPAWAGDSVVTPFELKLGASSAETLLSSNSSFRSPQGNIQAVLPNMTLTSPYAASLAGISLSVKYAFDTPVASGSPDEWSMHTKQVSAEIVVQSIDASQVIQQQSGGTTLTITLRATCRDVHLQLPEGATQASGTVALSMVNGKPGLYLKDFSANWAPASWKVTSMNCTGPNGFPQLVAQNAEAQLRTINPFVDSIKQQIQAQLDSAASSAPLSWKMPANEASGIELELNPTSLQRSPNGDGLIGGIATVTFSRVNGKCSQTIAGSVSDANSLSDSTGDSLLLPYDAVRALLKCAYYNGTLIDTWPSQQFPGFESLMQSYFSKLFAWPDLLNFNSDSTFYFRLTPSSVPKLGMISSDSAGNLLIATNAPVTVETFAPVSGVATPYVYFSTLLAGTAKMAFKNGAVTVTESIPALSVQSRWDATYVRNHNPNQMIADSTIAGYVRDYLGQTGLKFALPSWELPGQFSLSVLRADDEGSSVRVAVQIKKSAAKTQ